MFSHGNVLDVDNQGLNMNGNFHNDRFRQQTAGERKDYRNDRTANKPQQQNQQQNGSTLRAVDWTNISLIPFRKNFYKPATNQPQQEVDNFLKTHEITLRGTELPPPNIEFQDDIFPDYVMHSVKRQGFLKPTAIQATSWPIALSGRDLVGIARTGSGKTLVCIFLVIFNRKNDDFNASINFFFETPI